MKAEKYAKEVTRTLKVLPTLEENLLHISYGIITETGELFDIYKKKLAYGKEIDLVNLKEELGDIQWYIFNGFNFVKYDISLLKVHTREIFIDNSYKLIDKKLALSICSSNLFESIFRYSQKITPLDSVTLDLTLAYRAVEVICEEYNFDIENIFDINISKLRIRFPEKFTQDLALNRNLDNERNTLENT